MPVPLTPSYSRGEGDVAPEGRCDKGQAAPLACCLLAQEGLALFSYQECQRQAEQWRGESSPKIGKNH